MEISSFLKIRIKIRPVRLEEKRGRKLFFFFNPLMITTLDEAVRLGSTLYVVRPE